jgi:hypothetical protein
VDLLGVAAAVSLRHAGGARQVIDVAVKVLLHIADGDRAGDKDLGGLLAHRDQLFDLELLEHIRVHPVDVARDQA